LLQRAGITAGVVLDLGCATGPLAEPVRDLGLDYVGVDIDEDAIAELTARGFEGHTIDLRAPEDELVATLDALLGDRPLAAVLLLDVVEHVVDPGPLLRAVHRLDAERAGAGLIVSIPNATHVDVGIKLLLGRWDMTDIGLLDNTHLRFYNERGVLRTLGAAGWAEADAEDVVNAFSDQLFPADAPALRPGAPFRQILWRIRMAAAPHGETYQFVRRFTRAAPAVATPPDEPAGAGLGQVEDAPFLSIVVDVAADGGEAPPGAADALVRDLAAQTSPNFEVLIHGAGDDLAPWRSPLGDGRSRGVRPVPPGAGDDWRNVALAAAGGRYVAFLAATTRLAPRYVEAVTEAVEALPTRMVQVATTTAGAADLASARPQDGGAVVAAAAPLRLEPLDIVGTTPFGPVVLDAHAVPRRAARTNGLRFQAGDAAGQALFLIRAMEMCGIVRTDERLCTVPGGAAIDLAAQVDLVVKDLDQTPMVMPEGAASQLFALRATFLSETAQRDDLAEQLAEAERRIVSLTVLLREMEQELDQARVEADAARSRVGRLASKGKRRVGRALRRI
jgi:SAM-dependent methyltransferase